MCHVMSFVVAANGHTDCIRVMLRHVTASTHIDCADVHGRYGCTVHVQCTCTCIPVCTCT